MKRTFFFKSLLLAAMLAVGGSAWADTYDILYGTAVMEEGVTTGVTAQTDFTGDANEKTGITHTDANGTNCDNAMPIGGSVLYIGNSTSANWTKYFSTAVTSGKVYFACNYKVGDNNKQRIRIVGNNDKMIFGSASNNTGSNATQVVATICGTDISHYVRQPRNCHYGVKSLCIDMDNRIVTYELIVSSGNNSFTELKGTVALPDDITAVKGLYAAKVNYNDQVYIDNVMLYSVIPSGTKYTHILKAVDSDNNALGTLGLHAIYANTEAEASETLNYSRAINVGGAWYTRVRNNSEPYFGYKFAGGTETKNISYQRADNLTYFTEVENMTVVKGGSYGYWRDDFANRQQRCSNGSMPRFYAKDYAYTAALEGGVYKVTLMARNASSSSNSNINIGVRDASGNVTTFDYTFAEWGSETYRAEHSEHSVNVMIPDGSSFVLKNGDYNSNLHMDYLLFEKLTVNDVPEIVGDINYATNYFSTWNTTPVWINVGETGYYKFVNNNNTASANLYENWYLFGATEASENIVIFGPNHSNTATNATYNSKPTFSMADLDGATVELTTTLADAGDGTYTLTTTAVTTKADGTTLSPDLVYTQTGLTANKLKLYVSVEKNWLEVLEQRSYPSTVSATLGANGYTTFASPYALDLTGVSAYKAAVEGNVVRFTELRQTVPANTGFLLEGAAGATVTIPVVAAGTEVSGNAFLVNTAGETFDAEDGYTYYGMIKATSADDAIVFGTFAPGTVAIPANKAYLKVANAQAARLVAVFGDESTGINAVNGEGFTFNGSVYNLSGQRVAQPSKGLYIVNGKKVLVK